MVQECFLSQRFFMMCGGFEYIETGISLGMDKTYQMWMHDPEGNRFELMEYTDESYRLHGNPLQ